MGIGDLLFRRWRVLILTTVLVGSLLTLMVPVKTVKAIITNTGFTVVDNTISIDQDRIVFKSGTGTVTVYDASAGTSVSFAGPPCQGGLTNCIYQPVVYGETVVVTWFKDLTSATTIYYCRIPRGPLPPCGPWELVASGASFASFALWGFPVVHGDLVVWPISLGIRFWRFSTERTTTIGSNVQPYSLSTNGEVIAFAAKPAPTSPSYTLMFYDTSNPTQGIVNTNLPSGQYATSISEHTVAFQDNSTSPNRIRYYDILRNQASPAGTGPVGSIYYFSTPAISGDRIVFQVRENASDFNFDCNGNGVVSGSEFCLRYWNIRPTMFVASFLAPDAAPPIGLYPAIHGRIVTFIGADGVLRLTTIPFGGDVNQDGKVNILDSATVAFCYDQLLKNSTIC